jgi:hypothetical protein
MVFKSTFTAYILREKLLFDMGNGKNLDQDFKFAVCAVNS